MVSDTFSRVRSSLSHMSLAANLARHAGQFTGIGDGIESGPFTVTIDISVLPGGPVSVAYAAIDPHGTELHREHTIVSPGVDGRDRLYIAHTESPVVTELIETSGGSGRFEQATIAGPYTLAVVIDLAEVSGRAQLSYAWWWAPAGQRPVEQSRAIVALASASTTPPES